MPTYIVFFMLRLTSWNEAQMDCASQNMTLLQYTHEFKSYGSTLGDFPAGHDFAQIMFLRLKRNSQVFKCIYILPVSSHHYSYRLTQFLVELGCFYCMCLCMCTSTCTGMRRCVCVCAKYWYEMNVNS